MRICTNARCDEGHTAEWEDETVREERWKPLVTVGLILSTMFLYDSQYGQKMVSVAVVQCKKCSSLRLGGCCSASSRSPGSSEISLGTRSRREKDMHQIRKSSKTKAE
jgi:hypothetical protein